MRTKSPFIPEYLEKRAHVSSKMGKGRVRVKGAKGKRWRKGQSGTSNPGEARHRQAARGKFSDHLSCGRAPTAGQLLLTAEALASHAEKDRDGDVELREEGVGTEEESHSGHGNSTTSAASSSAFTLIETAHPVFGAVRKLWNSQTESHRVICAVLAAVSEVVKTHEGKDTETEYFGALMTVLESAQDEKSAAAICYLLGLLMPSVPREVLQLRYGTACRILTDQLALHETSSSTALLKSLVQALTLLLEAQPLATWSDSHCQTVFQNILNFTLHPKPKLRKAAQGGVVSMLRDGTSSGDLHPAASLTARHCRHVLSLGGVETTRLHVLGLLRDCLANVPTQHLKLLCEGILKTMALGSTLLRTTCLHALHGLMSSLAGPQGLTVDLTARITTALYDHQPSLADSQLLQAWLTVMLAAHTKLASLDRGLCVGHLVRLFSVGVACLLSHKTDVTHTAASAMQTLLREVVGPYVAALDSQSTAENKTKLQTLQKIYAVVVKGLDYKYQHSWTQALRTLAVFHRVAGGKCSSVMAPALPSLCSLHSLPDFKCTAQLEEAVGVAIATMGPQVVLKHVPLQLDSEAHPPSFPRSWLLPVLRDHVCCTQLAFFTDTMLPLAGRMRARAEDYHKAGKSLEAKLYDTLQHQVWSLLPGFCREPGDVPVSFPGLARILGTALTNRPELRVTIATSLRQLVQGSCEGGEDRAVLTRFSKNYLPILFNLYTGSSEAGEGERAALLACVQTYTTITDQTLLVSFFSKAVEKMSQENIEKENRHRLLDLVQALVPHLPAASLQQLLDTISPLLDSVDCTLQKKGYKVLQQLLSCEGHAHKAFVQDHLHILTSTLTNSLSTASTSSKKPRLRCLASLVDHIGGDGSDFIATITPEVILCTKEVNEKSRSLAFQLLVHLGYSAQRCYGLNAEESVSRYLGLVLAGLAGSAHMVSASVISLSRLLYEFHDVLGRSLVSRLVSAMCTLLSSRTREVVKAAFGFIKITIRVLPPAELSPHLERLVAGITRWSGDPKSHFRLKARFILERLIRKFSYEVVCGLVPRKHQRLMAHIRKSTERQKKKKVSSRGEEAESEKSESAASKRRHKLSYEDLLLDSSEDEEEERRGRRVVGQAAAASSRKGKRGGGSWIKEGGGEEPVNFLDLALARRIVSTDPREDRPRPPDRQPFQTSAEGKLVISEPGSEVGVSQSVDMATESAEEVGAGKRRRVWQEEDEAESGGGGAGIHRRNASKLDFSYGSEYRAKRARGDVKVKGQPDPYAYVPLMGQKLNRRKKAKLAGQFSGVMRKAKTGSAAGARQHGRKRR